MAPRHILLLTDRDWTHPQGGGTGTNLYGQVSRWIAWGHRVTVVAGSYPGAAPVERPAPNLELHRMGGRVTVFPRAALRRPARRRARRRRRARGRQRHHLPDAAVAAPAARDARPPRPPRPLRGRDGPPGRRGGAARRDAAAARALPLVAVRDDLRRRRGATSSSSASRTSRSTSATSASSRRRSRRASAPPSRGCSTSAGSSSTSGSSCCSTCSRASRRRISTSPARATTARRSRPRSPAAGSASASCCTATCREERKAELLARSWVNLTASSAEGWCLTVMEAALCATPSVALRVGGLPESIVDGETGPARRRRAGADRPGARAWSRTASCASGSARRPAPARETFTWERTAQADAGRAGGGRRGAAAARCGPRWPPRRRSRRRAWRPPRWPPTPSRWCSP